MKKLMGLLTVLCLALEICIIAHGEELAEDITAKCTITADGKTDNRLTDNSIYTYINIEELNISCDTPMHGLYIEFDRECAPWTMIADGTESTEGEDGFLHQYVPLNGVKEITINFEKGTAVADLFVFGQGVLPDFVQRWEYADSADIMICPTHSDDDQLYFAGMIPWCVANGYNVQIVYLTNHLNTHDRPHELLNGLWHCGVKYYPHIPEFPDMYSESFEQAKQVYVGLGYEYDGFVEYYKELLQKYKPLVVAGHDANGEYGHGMHMLSFHALTEAIELSAEEGLWDVPKTYIHLWAENAVTFNWDEPLEFFEGKTAFNVSQEGFAFHLSQHRFTGLTSWLYGTDAAPITQAAQIRGLSPCRFGLYRSTVGIDSTVNGLFENLEEYIVESSEESTVTSESTEEDISCISESTEDESSADSESADTAEITEEESEDEGKTSLQASPAATKQKESKTDMLPIFLLGGAGLCILLYVLKNIFSKEQ
ncbi:MAG: hypothetical protein E7597_07650 [Ruminococcaceae bacterium]|nr:hypothetical protein [Oscillospiraceae bacterium]